MEVVPHLLEALEALPIPVALIRRADGLIRFANRQLAETMRVPPGTLVGLKSLAFYVDPADRQALLARLERDGRVTDHELAVIRGDGTKAVLSLWVEPIEFQGEPFNFTSAIDITQRRTAEQKLTAEQQVLRRLVDITERDRQLLGYELHDGLVQDMTAATMFLESAASEFENQTGEACESLNIGLTLVRDAVREARRLIGGLQPPALDQGNAILALQRLVEELRKTWGKTIEFHHELGQHRFLPALELAVYRIAQEALQNAVRHSHASRITVSIALHEEMVRMTIVDNGEGFVPASVSRKRYGLVGIRERARLLGGTAIIESAPGQGTQIIVDLPTANTLALTEPDLGCRP
ncbi:MAG: PAS domain-containing sensor histidine kinase [Pirellulales bacterium]